MTKPDPNIYDLIHLNGPLDYHMGSELRFWRWKYSSGASVFQFLSGDAGLRASMMLNRLNRLLGSPDPSMFFTLSTYIPLFVIEFGTYDLVAP
jgi:hypothetical protein